MSAVVVRTQAVHSHNILDEVLTYLKLSENVTFTFKILVHLPRDKW